MARTTKPLTDTEIKKAKIKDKEYNLSDGAGLALRIKPNGIKGWIFNYSRPYTKKRSNLSIGNYPEVTLAEARVKRREYRNLLSKNVNRRTKLTRFSGETALKSFHPELCKIQHLVGETWRVLSG